MREQKENEIEKLQQEAIDSRDEVSAAQKKRRTQLHTC
jgi:hypothetical protein